MKRRHFLLFALVAVALVAIFLPFRSPSEQQLAKSLVEEVELPAIFTQANTQPVDLEEDIKPDLFDTLSAEDHWAEPETSEHQPDAEAITADSSEPSQASGQLSELQQAIAQAWVVQVGSFADNEGAQKLLMQLRQKNMVAFSKRVTLENGKNLTRVFLGPEIHREQAEALQQTLHDQFAMNGLITAYHPMVLR